MSRLVHNLWSLDEAFEGRFASIRARSIDVMGHVPRGPLVAVVGSRAACTMSMDLTYTWAKALAEAGIGVVSGGAIGIDTAAHSGALAGNGRTYAVLGCGIDITYPQRNRGLFARMLAQGGVLTPFAPGVPPRPGHFVARNELIAALADVVVVVEAHLKSGSLSTARYAVALGRSLFAVPGSAGCDGLLASRAARSCRDVALLIAATRGQLPAPDAPNVSAMAALSEGAQGVFAALAEPADLDAVCDRTGVSPRAALAALGELESAGVVLQISGDRYQRVSSEHKPMTGAPTEALPVAPSVSLRGIRGEENN